MIGLWTGHHLPDPIRKRHWWLLVLLGWAVAVVFSLHLHMDDLRRQYLDMASESARNLFRMVVLTRAWNAEHGGVYVPVTRDTQPNPYLVHPRRDLETRDGQRLTMINPAYMTRQLSELARTRGGVEFHITSLKPLRPANTPDPWEREALNAFEYGHKEWISLMDTETVQARIRYMAPLRVAPPCMSCHAAQGYQVGDIRGGISVTVPLAPLMPGLDQARHQTITRHLVIFLVISVLGWGLLELLRKRWLDLSEYLSALGQARDAMQRSNVELAHARDAAESSSRAKSQFLSAMSHELRTPLNSILGFSHLLQHADLPEKPAAQAASIADQGERLLALVNEVIEFARLEKQQAAARQETMDLPSCLKELAEELRQSAASRHLAARIDLAADLPVRVAGDGAWLSGCLRRVLDNAVKFTRAGEVGLSARAVPNGADSYSVRIVVSDTGPGIAPADRDKLFQPFRQIDESTTRTHGGLGLGLAIAARYAGLLGAQLNVDSEPGKGSRFHLVWQARAVTSSVSNGLAKEPADADQALDELERLLREDDLRATTLLGDLLPMLARDHDGKRLAQLKQQVERYDYPAALDTLRALRAG